MDPTSIFSTIHTSGYRFGQNVQLITKNLLLFLTPGNENEIITTFTYPRTPVPEPTEDVLTPSTAYAVVKSLVEYYINWWTNEFHTNPSRVLIETTLLSIIIYLFLYKTSASGDGKSKEADNKGIKLTSSEKTKLLQEWKATQLAPKLSQSSKRALSTINERVITSVSSPFISTATQPRIYNMSSFDFLSLSTQPLIRAKMSESMLKYGFGSCGPRGFYGTIDSHLNLERKLANVFGLDTSIMYSDGASTVSSTIAAFAKRGDLVIVDAGVSECVLTGITLSRANFKTFKHNDMNSLRAVLEAIKLEDSTNVRRAKEQRRFIIVEGLYRNYGTICKLKEVLKLKNEFKYRIILDDSYGFGCLGKKGLGVLDHFGLLPDVNVSNNGSSSNGNDISHSNQQSLLSSSSSSVKSKPQLTLPIEILTISLENSLSTIGGITLGSPEVVDHQRLSGSGYCFSASAPPFLAEAGIVSLNILEDEGVVLADKLKRNLSFFLSGLKAIPEVTVTSDLTSPIIFLTLTNPSPHVHINSDTLSDITTQCFAKGLAITYTGDHVKGPLLLLQPDGRIRLTVSVGFDERMLEECLGVMGKVVKDVVRRR